MKKCMLLMGLLLSAALVGSDVAETPGGDESGWHFYEIPLSEVTPEVFSGTVEYAKQSTLSFEVAGRLEYVAPEGVSAKADIISVEDDAVARLGRILARQDDDLALAQVSICEAKLKTAELRFDEREQNFQRDKTLHEKKVISDRNFLESQIAYESALYDKSVAALELVSAKRRLDACYIRAPYPCVVSRVVLRPGAVADVAQEVLSIASVEAMKVVIPVPEYITRRLDMTTQIRVFPEDRESPVAAWFEGRDIKTDQLHCYVDNPLIPVGTLTAEQEKLAEVDGLSFVFEPGPSTEGLAQWWVLPAALHQDESGYYVWRLQGVKAVTCKDLIPREVTLERVPVTPTSFDYNQGIYELRGIADSKLEAYDMLASEVPATVQSGDKVVYRTKRRLFRPGEKVSVIFSKKFAPSTFLVPRAALVVDYPSGTISVRVWNAGTIETVPVSLFGDGDEMVRVRCGRLAAGLKLIVPPPEAMADQATPKLMETATPVSEEILPVPSED